MDRIRPTIYKGMGMSLFFKYLNDINSAKNKADRKAAATAAAAQIPSLTGDENWEDYTQYGEWVNSLPELIKNQREQAEFYLLDLIEVVKLKNKIFSEDKAEKLRLKIKRCKSLDELKALETVSIPYEFEYQDDFGNKFISHPVITLEDRIENLNKKDDLDDNGWSIRFALANQKKYLSAKHTADKWAWPLTIVLCMLGIGMVCGVAMFAAWPVMGVVGFLAASAVIGYVEIPVFYSFIKRSLRNIFARGVFESIDNRLLNDLAKEEGRKDRHAFDDNEKEARLNSGATKWWRYLKYTLTSVGGLVTLISTFGFAALAYTQILEVLPLIGITAGIGMVAIPCFFAIVSIPYFFVMFDNIYRAIKNNIFLQIWQQIKDVYYMNGFTTASGKDQFIHLLKCLGRSVVVALVFAIVVAATVFSAGAWLQGSVNFVAGTLGIANAIAEKIGMLIGSIQLATNLGFNFENCFKTIGRLDEVFKNTGKGVKSYFVNVAERVEAEPFIPKKVGIAVWSVLRLIVKFGPLMLHVFGVGMLSAQGTEAFILKPLLGGSETASIIVAASTQAMCEALEDTHTLISDHSHDDEEHDHHHEHHEHHDHHDHHAHKSGCDSHEHADPAADVEWLAEKAVVGVGHALTFFKRVGKPPEMVDPLPERITVNMVA